MPVETVETGVIFCPGCDGVLRWERIENDERQITDDAMEHLRVVHGSVPKSRLLASPAPVSR